MTKKKQKILTIVTVVKNDVQNIGKTIQSIITQKNNNLEYIIVDGKSKDGTLEIISSYKKYLDKIIIGKDSGIYHAMNKGIKHSSGKYIGFCNSGDIITKESIQILIKFLNTNPDVLFATVKRHYLGKSIIKHGYDLNRLKYNFDFATAHSTGFYVKKSLHKIIGLYDTKFRCSSDYDLYYRLLINKRVTIKSTPKNKIIGVVQKGGFSSSLTSLEHLTEESKIRIKNKQNLLFILIIYINTLVKIFLKKFLPKKTNV
jgi:glycosyltransferase involved in cell wall biosynthesis